MLCTKPGQQIVNLSAEISDCRGQRNSLNISTWLSDVGGPILPLRGLVAHRDDTYRVKSLISALVERMLRPGLCRCACHRLATGIPSFKRSRISISNA